MSLLKILPRIVRVTSFYVKAKKIYLDETISREVKLNSIHKLEREWIGDATKLIKGTSEIDIPIAIGIKDIARIYIELQSPDDALHYLSIVEECFPVMMKIKSDNDNFFQMYVFSLLYRGKAYAQKGDIDKSFQQFNQVNCIINERIANKPSDSTLQELYGYTNSQIFKSYLTAAETFAQNSNHIYKTCLTQLKEFEKRDPGNEQINDYISRFA